MVQKKVRIKKKKTFIVPLGLEEMEESLGPGYGIGYWGWENLVGRPDQCRVSREELERQRGRVNRLRQTRFSSVEQLCQQMTSSGRPLKFYVYSLLSLLLLTSDCKLQFQARAAAV